MYDLLKYIYCDDWLFVYKGSTCHIVAYFFISPHPDEGSPIFRVISAWSGITRVKNEQYFLRPTRNNRVLWVN